MMMRSPRLTAKMGPLMAFTIAALATVAFAYDSTMLGNSAFSAKEREGVRHAQTVYPALLAWLDARRDAAARAAGNAALQGQRALADRLPPAGRAAGRAGGRHAGQRDGGDRLAGRWHRPARPRGDGFFPAQRRMDEIARLRL